MYRQRSGRFNHLTTSPEISSNREVDDHEHEGLYHGTLDPDHILHGQLAGLPDFLQEILKSRCPFVPTTRKLLNDPSKLGIRAAKWTNYRWIAEYLNAHLYSMFSFPGPVLGH